MLAGIVKGLVSVIFAELLPLTLVVARKPSSPQRIKPAN
jgi:hypothetical protein